MAKKSPFLIVETAVLRKRNPENGLGIYHVIAKTADGMLYEFNNIPELAETANMFADLLLGTMMVSKDWTVLAKVM